MNGRASVSKTASALKSEEEERLRRALDSNFWPPYVWCMSLCIQACVHTHRGGVCSRRNNSGQEEMLYVQPLPDKSIEGLLSSTWEESLGFTENIPRP